MTCPKTGSAAKATVALLSHFQISGRTQQSSRQWLVFKIQCLELLGCCRNALVSRHDN